MNKKSNKPSTLNRGSFDGIANKFDKNIYGTTKGKLRHQLLLFHLSQYIKGEPDSVADHSLKVADVGAGTGMMAIEFAKHGHAVHLYDVSAEALDIAQHRLKAFPESRFYCQSFSDINEQYDFIICHALLEWLTKPIEAINKLINQLKPNGVLSLSFFNHDAKVFNNLLYGNFDYVKAGLPPRNTVRLNPHNAQEISVVMQYLESLENVEVLSSNGIRCIHDYMLDKTRIDPQYDSLFELELEYGARAPFKYLGKYFHIMLTKSA